MNGDPPTEHTGVRALWHRLRHPALRARAWWIAGLYAAVTTL